MLAIALNSGIVLVNKSGHYTIWWTKIPKTWSPHLYFHVNHLRIFVEKMSAI